MQRLLANDGWDLGTMRILQPDYPVWETVASACWYEMEAGAIYCQMDPRAAELLFPIAYEQGATYFWFWTSDHAHHVPFEEQFRRARALRRHAAAHPRRAECGGVARWR